MTAGGALHVALVCGYLTTMFPGFAHADDVQEMHQLQKMMLLNGLEKDVFDARQSQCRTADPVARSLYLQRLDDKLGQYSQASGGKRPRIPECWEFGTVAAIASSP